MLEAYQEQKMVKDRFGNDVPSGLIEKKYKETNRVGISKKENDKLVALDTLTITHNTVAYDADGKALGNMASVISIANAKFNRAISIGIALDPATPTVLTVLALIDAYNLVFKSTIYWKGADNLPHQVQIESVAEALEKAMYGRAAIYGV